MVMLYVCYRGGEIQLKKDVDLQKIYGRNPKPLCPPHLITLQYHSLLRFFVRKLAPTSGSLQLCPEIMDNILIAPEFI